MAHTIEYFLSLTSPWTYLGHGRFCELARRLDFEVRPYPVEMGKVFAVSGGLPLPKRSKQRQAYRMAELERWRAVLEVPLNLEPRYFPNDETMAARLVLGLRAQGIDVLPVVGSVLGAVWAEDRDIADSATLGEIAAEHGFDLESVMSEFDEAAFAQTRGAETQYAIDRGVFGAPTYVLDDELFWGQDRLDLLERQMRITSGTELESKA